MMVIKRADDGEGADGMVAVKFEPLKSGLVLLADDQDQKVISITDVFKFLYPPCPIRACSFASMAISLR